MCDVCVGGGGGDKQFGNATQQMVRVKGRSQCMLVAMYKYIHTIIIKRINGGFQKEDHPTTAPSASPSGEVEPPLLGKWLILFGLGKLVIVSYSKVSVDSKFLK